MLYALPDRRPEIGAGCYVAPSADVIGSVRLLDGASVWFGCVLRGDSDLIEIGAGSNIQDGTVMHTDPGFPLRIGSRVTVGHRALVHNVTIADESLIGNGAIVLDRVSIGRHCIIGAGALIPPDKVIPDGVVVMGSPGRVVREVGERELALIRRSAEVYRQRALQYRALQVTDARAS